ncbi:DUF5713 family protein [Aureispira anguillae]|uniref:DUF5713 family protein n=1 Tax=Aureispira anguillae TaxID=2864201 RepID=A0A915YE96_9BACT|nr:DUF5713 family protein [Aureispira anguillae]BDS11418.1 DUF5713 family protein [Aureispira anguillae]
MMHQKELKNETTRQYNFLSEMYADTYFPSFLVDKIKNILVELCFKIEKEQPQNLEALYLITHASTEKINDLEQEFYENDSEIETAARDCIGGDFEAVAIAYGYDADIEMLIATRDW